MDWALVAMAVGTWAMAFVMALANWRIIRQNQSLVSAAGQQMKESIQQTQLMRLQFEAMMRGIERPQIIELAKEVLNPFIYELDLVIKTRFPRKLTIWGDEEGLLNDLERRRPGIKLMVEKHNKDSEVLDAGINGLKGAINTPEFKENCRELVIKYNAAVPPGKQLHGDPNSYAEQLTYFVIQNKKDFGDSSGESSMVDFWRVHGGELLKAREKDDIQGTVKEVDSLRDEYLKNARELREKFVQLREKWVVDFNLLRGEIGQERGV